MIYDFCAGRLCLARPHTLAAGAAMLLIFFAVTFAAAQEIRTPDVPAQVRHELSQYPSVTNGKHIPSATNSKSALDRTAESIAVGDLDTTFTPVFDSRPGFAYTVVAQPDGKFLVGGGFKSFNGFATAGMVRLNADRSIDTSFSADISGTVFAIALQPDGKIVIGGTFVAVDNVARYSVARLNTDGSLDPTLNMSNPTEDIVRDILVQPDGKIVAVGNFDYINGVVSPRIARLNSDGTLDSGFQSLIAFGNPPGSETFISSVAIQPDGRLVIVGSLLIQGGSIERKFVYRLNADGSVDPAFTSPTMNSNPWSVALQADGKIVIGGFFTTINSTSRVRIARLNGDGSLDTTFNPGTGASSSVLSVNVMANGQIMATGNFSTINGTPRGGVALFNPEGTLDATFAPAAGTAGSVYGATPNGSGYLINGTFVNLSGVERSTLGAMNADGSVDVSFSAETRLHTPVRSILVLPDGKMLVGGLFNQLNGEPCFGITRLNANGTRDLSFDGTAVNALNVGRLIQQPDGKILVIGAGIRINNGPTKLIVRLNADGTPDLTFDQAAIAQSTQGNTAAVQPDGKIVFSFYTIDTIPLGGLVRLNPNGSIDESFSSSNRQIDAIHILPNGQILIAGPFSLTYVGPGGSETHAALMRLNSDGTHDRTFRSALRGDHPTFSEVHAMHVQADGKILVGGKMYTGDGSTAFGVLRLNATGTGDGSFQGQSIAGPFYFTNVNALHVTPSGKILAAGTFESFGGTIHNNIVRLLPNGLVDTTFTTGTDKSISAVTTQSNGSVLIGGTFSSVNGIARPVIARLLAEPTQRTPFDFDGDGKTDIGIFRSSAAEWWISRSGDNGLFATQFGATTDAIVPADYTGDGKTDIAFWRPSSGDWFVLRSEDFSYFSFPFGANGDVPVSGDYDADGKADSAVFRPSNATWYIRRSTDGQATIQQFGAAGDIPVAADYDGDGRVDLAIFRPTLGQWWINRSTAGVIATTFGDASVKPVPGDYTGDGKADVAFWRPSTGEWFVLRSEDFSYYSAPFGTTGDVPAPGDYDGDGKFDLTVFRPSNATWYANRSTGGTLIQQFGQTGDRPIPNAFVP